MTPCTVEGDPATRSDAVFRKDLWWQAYRLSVYRELRWTNVTYEDPKSEKNLRSATGRVFPGQIVSVWGPLDSGVDILAQVLAGTLESYTGTVESSFAKTTFAALVKPSVSLFPETHTMREALEFYLRAVFSGPAGLSSKTFVEVEDVVREFELTQIQYKRCNSLSSTEKQLLYVISMILKPEPILILHNVNRHLTNRQCQLISRRIRLLADTGHTILLISSFTSATFLEMSDYVHVFHTNGKEFYAGSPLNLQDYLQRSDVAGIENRYSYEDLLYCAFSIEQKDFKRLVPRTEDPPRRSSVYSDSSSCKEERSVFLLFLIMRRTMSILIRHDSLLRAKLLVVFCFAFTCKVFHSQDPAKNAAVVVDLFLLHIAGASLIFATLESSIIDRVLIEEGRGPLKEVYKAATVIGSRVFLIILCDSLMTSLLCKLLVSWANFPNGNDLPRFTSTAITCSLFYTFMGSFCGLSEKKHLRTLIHVMILSYVIAAMVTLGPAIESDSLVRSFNPVFIAKRIIFSNSMSTPGIVIRGNYVYGSEKRLLSRKVGFWEQSGLLLMSAISMLALYAIHFSRKLRGRRLTSWK